MLKKIKKTILYFLLIVFKYHLRIIYWFIKLFTKQREEVFLLSRQFNELPLNYELLINELKKKKIKYKYICKKVPSSVNIIIRNENKSVDIGRQLMNIIKYYFNLYKQMVYCATSKVIIVDGYNITVSLLNHKDGTKVIQLWHALAAIKKFGYQTIGYKDGLNPQVAKILCMHKNYDYIISGSKEMNKYFAEAFNTPIYKLKEYGTPTIDYLLKDNKTVINKIYKKYPQMKEKINVLYSPTFRSDGRNNDLEVINKFDTEKYNLIMTYHPKNKNNYFDKNIINIDRNEFSTFDILRVVDYVITDYSALTIDACVLNKKVLLYVYDYEQYKEENGLNIDLFKELKGNVSESIESLIKIIDNNKYNMKSYNNFRKKYITNLKGDSTKEIFKLIKESL